MYLFILFTPCFPCHTILPYWKLVFLLCTVAPDCGVLARGFVTSVHRVWPNSTKQALCFNSNRSVSLPLPVRIHAFLFITLVSPSTSLPFAVFLEHPRPRLAHSHLPFQFPSFHQVHFWPSIAPFILSRSGKNVEWKKIRERERQPVTKTEQGEQGQTVLLLLRISSSLSVFFSSSVLFLHWVWNWVTLGLKCMYKPEIHSAFYPSCVNLHKPFLITAF